jgi:hypothetical protein
MIVFNIFFDQWSCLHQIIEKIFFFKLRYRDLLHPSSLDQFVSELLLKSVGVVVHDYKSVNGLMHSYSGSDKLIQPYSYLSS